MDPNNLVESYNFHERVALELMHKQYEHIIRYILSNFSIDHPDWTYEILLLYITRMTTRVVKTMIFPPPSGIHILYPKTPETGGEVVMFIKNICDELAIPIFDRPFVQCVINIENFFAIGVQEEDY